MMAFLRCFATLVAPLLLASCAGEEPRGPVVLAAASMQELLTEVAEAWAAEGNAAPVLSFAATPALARQVEQGAPADLFISADAEWMDWLAERGLVDTASRRDIVGNALVLVASEEFYQGNDIAVNLRALGEGRLALADPDSVPAGRYARASLERMGLWAEVESQIVPAENVRAALALVEAGEARLGIVYATDARASQRVRLVAQFAPEVTPAITYPAAQLVQSRHSQAQDFLAFLSSPQAQEIFAAHGFLPPDRAP